MIACACCGYLTVPAVEENCPLCDWYNDAQGDADADSVWLGAHPTSLTQARRNFHVARSSHDLTLDSEVAVAERHAAPLRDQAIAKFEQLRSVRSEGEAAQVSLELTELLLRITKVRHELLLTLMRLQGD